MGIRHENFGPLISYDFWEQGPAEDLGNPIHFTAEHGLKIGITL